MLPSLSESLNVGAPVGRLIPVPALLVTLNCPAVGVLFVAVNKVAPFLTLTSVPEPVSVAVPFAALGKV